MKFNFKELLQKAKDFWSGLEKKKKILYLSVAGGAVAVTVILTAMLAKSNSKVSLYKGLGVNEANRVAARLRTVGVKAEVDDSGAVTVPKNEVAKAEMQLSLEGYTRAPYSYDIFKEGNSLLSSDSEKKAYLLFEIQNRIESAIKTIEGIDDAMVTIALPENDSFVLSEDKEKPSASVKLVIGGLVPTITPKQVAGIKVQVARSVPGLEVDRVAVLDNYGNLLETDDEKSTEKDIDFMKMKDKVDSNIREKVLSLLVPMFGKDNVKVAANSVLNYDGKKTKETSYTPVVGDNGIIQHREEILISKESGKTQNADVGLTEGNAEISTYPEQANQNESASTSKRDISEDYLVNKKEEQTVKNTPTVDIISVAVAINQEEMAEQQKGELRRLVASAAGISEDRVELCSMKFTSVTGLDSNMTVGEFFKTPLGVIVLVLSLVVVLLLLVLLIFVLRARSKAKKSSSMQQENVPEMTLEEFMNSTTPNNEAPANENILQNMNEQMELNTTNNENENSNAEMSAQQESGEEQENSVLESVLKFVDENSEIASQFIKSWIRSEEDVTKDD
ncbi:MAG: flagellar M-ring protein FliF [Oscillospiraceae bacterium]|nr:flagellar M-ring protein FliF [Oscillospiraceae bacterium]